MKQFTYDHLFILLHEDIRFREESIMKYSDLSLDIDPVSRRFMLTSHQIFLDNDNLVLADLLTLNPFYSSSVQDEK